MKTLTITYKHESQIGNSIITAANRIVIEATQKMVDYIAKYNDTINPAEMVLEKEYGFEKASQMVVISAVLS